MTESEAWNSGVSSLLKNIYRCADKSSWYSDVAEAYDRTRPRYPSQLIERVGEIARLQPQKRVLEIGSGPGIASIELAKLGVELVGIEPSLAACEIARRKCANYSNVEFINTTFEEWKLTSQRFDAVIATTSFHWVTPEIRTRKSALALKNRGCLVLLWNTPPQPSYEIGQKLTEVYQTHAPDLAFHESIENHQQNLDKFGQEIIDSGYFQDLVSEQMICQLNYTTDEYLTLLTTLSPYINLKPTQRHLLLAELKKVLQLNYGDRLELSYLSLFQIARKFSTGD
ncbi:MAG: methyltransferase domain-containing protein [Pleurocapsa sp. MO_226.B13]|nr:methyltransferase domain-containing protein [Pleurocapsa sp. MO_226.B13]